MTKFHLRYFPLLTFIFYSCHKTVSNGESIFRTGKNSNGEVVSFQETLGSKRATGCQDCHGRQGGNVLNRDESIKYRHLSDPKLHTVPYDDRLIRRFLDEKIKSNGSKANTPVITKMSEQDQADLISFLKSL